jgi:glycosyltransferase involved in cell wall biosynthesis
MALLNKICEVTIMLGAGHHQEKLVDALKQTGYPFEVFKYYPKFTFTRYNSRKEITSTGTNHFYSFLVKVVWALFVRINFLKKTNLHIYFAHCIYDYWVSKNVSNSSKLLWAWSQVSLITIKKFKKQNAYVVNESPTIHISEWSKIMNAEYNMFAKNKYQYYKIHKRLSQRIISEYELSDKIVVLSTYAKDTFLKNGISPNKLVQVNLFASEGYSKCSNTLENKNFVKFLFVGRVDVLKGIPRLIKVVSKMSLAHKNFSLTIVGEMKEEVEDLFRNHLDFIRIVKPINKGELNKVYSEHDVLVLPSVQESFGLVILEALTNGLFVLASLNSGAPDVSKESNRVRLIDPLDEADIEKAIMEVLADPQSYKRIVSSNNNGFSKDNYELSIKKILESGLTSN